MEDDLWDDTWSDLLCQVSRELCASPGQSCSLFVICTYVLPISPPSRRNDGAGERVKLLTAEAEMRKQNQIPIGNIGNITLGTCGDQVTPPAPSLKPVKFTKKEKRSASGSMQ